MCFTRDPDGNERPGVLRITRLALLLSLAVGVLLMTPSAEAAVTHDADARRTFGLYLILVVRADDELRACYGCPAAARSVRIRATAAVTALTALTSHSLTTRGSRGLLRAEFAMRTYREAAASFVDGYPDHYDQWMIRAIRYASPAAEMLGLGRAWFHTLMANHGCRQWARSLVRNVAPCDY